MTTVVNVRHDKCDIYIGRGTRSHKPSKWGNPFVIPYDGDRDEVIAKYEVWIREQPELMAAIPELKDKVLGCWCHPLNCHASILIRLIEELDQKKAGPS